MTMSASNGAFAFILTLGAGFFALNVQRLVSYMRLGVADDRTDHPLARLKNVLTIGIAQTKIFRDPVAGTMHALIFWGFMVLTAGTVEILIQGVFSDFSYALILPRAVVPAVRPVAGWLRGARHRGDRVSRFIAGWCCIRAASRATSSSTPTR